MSQQKGNLIREQCEKEAIEISRKLSIVKHFKMH